MNFQQKLENNIKKNNSLLCVGLDPVVEKLPKKFQNKNDSIFSFNKWIIEQTKDYVCCFKPDIAFYEAYGFDGLKSLKKTISYIKALGFPVLLDAKRGSVGHTAAMYAKNIFEFWDADAVTLNIFTGISGLAPFLKYKNRWSFAYIASSNLDGQEFQKAPLENGKMLYEFMAKKVNSLKNKNIGAIVPATDPEIIKYVRKVMPKRLFLIPGIGAQGGSVKQTVQFGQNQSGGGIIISASRNIIYADNPKGEAKKLRDEINKYRK